MFVKSLLAAALVNILKPHCKKKTHVSVKQKQLHTQINDLYKTLPVYPLFQNQQPTEPQDGNLSSRSCDTISSEKLSAHIQNPRTFITCIYIKAYVYVCKILTVAIAFSSRWAREPKADTCTSPILKSTCFDVWSLIEFSSLATARIWGGSHEIRRTANKVF